MPSRLEHLLPFGNTLEIAGEKVEDNETYIVMRVDHSLFEIPKNYIAAEDTVDAGGRRLTKIKIDPKAKIVQSFVIDYEKGQLPFAANIFRRRQRAGVGFAGENDCSFCICDCSGDCVETIDCEPPDCSRCICDCSSDCIDGECLPAFVGRSSQSRWRFRRRR